MSTNDDQPPLEDPRLEDLLVAFRDDLLRVLQHRASGLLRFESVEDLAQDIHLRAIRAAEHFEYRSDPEFRAWVLEIAGRHIADRHAYWSARKRSATRMLRITLGGASTFSPGVQPPAAITGPVTFAERREHIVLATRALDLLLDRDRNIVLSICEGSTVGELAAELKISHSAAEKARTRAFDRFRTTFELFLSKDA